jgi:uncharacterized membrane protein YtjA (UPF0391 family)
MLNNLLGIPPMLALAGIADAVGIPSVLFVVGAGTVVMAVVSLIVGRRRLQRPAPTATRDQSDAAAALREPMEVRK